MSNSATAVHGGGFSRPTALRTAGLATALDTLEMVAKGHRVPVRLASRNVALPDIQYDIDNFIAPVRTEENGVVRFGPQQTTFLTATLTRDPTRADQASLAAAMAALETTYAFAAGGIFCFLSYGIPYFNRLNGDLVSSRMPKLSSDTSRPVLEEAVSSPTDVSPDNPAIVKQRFNVPARIENNDMLITIRGDDAGFVADVVRWFGGSNTLAGRPVASPVPGLLDFTSSRAMFRANGLPRFVAGYHGLPFAPFVHPMSPMWLGFADQQVDGGGPAAITTFVGNSSAKVTTAAAGDYFDNGSIQHLSHDILDLHQWFDLDLHDNAGSDGTFLERVQHMFRSNRPQQHRFGHLSALQRSSRAGDGTPMHVRMDGAGFDNMDVPDGSNQPKLQFTVFVPSSDFFATMRAGQAGVDLRNRFTVADTDGALERFMTATRRQNFLAPPRRHRAFPLVELS
ncbi:MAG TPA: hypothetical protein VGL06_04355 [Pseudonocardiaceae bacterium]